MQKYTLLSYGDIFFWHFLCLFLNNLMGAADVMLKLSFKSAKHFTDFHALFQKKKT